MQPLSCKNGMPGQTTENRAPARETGTRLPRFATGIARTGDLMRRVLLIVAAATCGAVIAAGCGGGGGSGASAPAAPSSLNGVIMDAGVHLTWSDNSSDEDGFVVEKTTNGSYARIGTTLFDVAFYHDADVTTGAGIQYSYRVFATNAAGASAPSNVFSITP
jgi:hypothetical protein